MTGVLSITAPVGEDVTLLVREGRGRRYRLPYPCRRTAAGRISSSNGTLQTAAAAKRRNATPMKDRQRSNRANAFAPASRGASRC
jgi:hypothetical protein